MIFDSKKQAKDFQRERTSNDDSNIVDKCVRLNVSDILEIS